MMATPESKVYPVEQTDAEKRVAGLASFLQKMGGLDLPFNFGSSFEKDPRSAYQTAQNILQTVDPYQQGGVGEYLPGFSMDLARERNDPLGETLSYLDLIPAGGAVIKGAANMAVIPLIAKYNDDIKKLRFDHRREMRNADGGDGQFAIDAANKIERKIKTLTNKRDKAISNIKDPGERKAAELSTINIFHGSPVTDIEKGIGTLKLPKELNYLKTGQRYPSSGGIYSVINPADPRLKSFSEKGSAYRINPNFNRTLDIENMPSDVRGSLGDMLQYIARPSRDTGKNMPLKRMQYQLDTMLHGGKGSVNKTPAQFSEDIANELIKKDYDSILFPPRNFKGEGETVLALNPEALNITGEIPVNELDDFIRAYLKFNK